MAAVLWIRIRKDQELLPDPEMEVNINKNHQKRGNFIILTIFI
jgi:hypothetical protein